MIRFLVENAINIDRSTTGTERPPPPPTPRKRGDISHKRTMWCGPQAQIQSPFSRWGSGQLVGLEVVNLIKIYWKQRRKWWGWSPAAHPLDPGPGPLWKWFISSYFVAYIIDYKIKTMTDNCNRVWKISKVKSLLHQTALVLISIAKIGKMVKNEILASTSILSFFSLAQAILLSTHNIYFYGELMKIILQLSSNTLLTYSSNFWVWKWLK